MPSATPRPSTRPTTIAPVSPASLQIALAAYLADVTGVLGASFRPARLPSFEAAS